MGRSPRALVATAALPLSGCGTICNFAGGFVHPDEPRVYGGVLRDLEILGDMAN
jgi:hypothetical protein